MILKNQPLSDYVAQYREAGIDVAAFPTLTSNRFALRLVDPDDPEIGTAFLASFKSDLPEANIPDDDKAATEANKKLNAMLADPAQMSRYTVCYCVIDQKSLQQFPDKYTEDDLGRQFLVVSRGSVKSLAYREFEEAKTESRRTRARR